MKILIVSFFDDNFGDMLIRICFDRIIRIVLKNLNVKDSDYTIDCMPLKRIDEDKVAVSDIIFFAGGGLFGLSYLNFFEFIDTITKIAEKNNIPVIFSSLGINNMDAAEENEQKLAEILKRSCIKSMSVRENPELFHNYAGECGIEIVSVCDPAVWTKYVYSREIQRIRAEKMSSGRKIVGINVVRGGLFKDNGRTWTLRTEEKYLYELKKLLEEEGIDVCFFTNGSFLDNNTMGYFARIHKIPDEQLIYPDSTREVVEAIARFDAVIAIRMHTSIISYSLNIPSIDLVWNDKITFFYKNIGYPDRAIPIEECTPELVFEKTKMLLKDTEYKADQNYMMSLYRYLYRVLSEIFHVDSSTPYSFEEVVKELKYYEASINDDVLDFRMKIKKGAKSYLSLFTKDKNTEKQIKDLKHGNERLINQLEEQKKKIEKIEKTAAEIKQELIKKQQETVKLKQQLNSLNSIFVVRVYKKLRRITGKLKELGK